MATKQTLAPIPIPFHLRWKEFRMRVLPFVVFLFALVILVQLWSEHVAPPMMLGEVEVVRTMVTSPADGMIRDLRIRSFEAVRAGDYLGEIVTITPELAERNVAVLRAEIEQVRVGLDPVANFQRNTLNYEGLRLDWFLQRVALATAQVKLEQAESDAARITRLYERGVASEEQFDAVSSERRVLQVEVASLAETARELEVRLNTLDTELGRYTDVMDEHLESTLRLLEERIALLEAEMAPIPLIAPQDGMVGAIERYTGEFLTAGEPILYINSGDASRIIAYLRQPASSEPVVGDLVEVRKRNRPLESGIAEVLGLGSQLEPATLTLHFSMQVESTTERVLPMLVSVPPNLSLRPGEVVDLLMVASPRERLVERLRFW